MVSSDDRTSETRRRMIRREPPRRPRAARASCSGRAGCRGPSWWSWWPSDVAALGGRRLEPEDLVERGGVVLDQLRLVERHLADDEVQVRVRSTRNSILPPLMSATALATSGVTVPVFGFGIRPRGPRTRPRRPTLPIRSGVATTASKSSRPLVTSSISSSSPTMSAPAARGLLGTLTGGEDQDPGGLAGAVRQVDGAADHLVGLARVDTQAHGDLDGRVVLRGGGLLGQPDGLERGVQRVRRRSSRRRRGRPCCASLLLLRGAGVSGVESWYVGPRSALPRRAAWCGWLIALDRDAHLAGGAGDDLLGGVEVVGVEVGHLGLGDLADLRRG